jgi:hypothetical protein
MTLRTASPPTGHRTSLPRGPASLLREATVGPFAPRPDLWGFGGLHGGLTLGLFTAMVQRQVPTGAALQSATARYHRSIRSEVSFGVEAMRVGSSVASFTGRAVDDTASPHVDAAVVFGAVGETTGPTAAGPPPPNADPPGRCEVFTIPPELVPFAQHTEIRPVSTGRPFAGGPTPELVAWLRLVEDDEPPDAHRLVVLMDSLAPSYAAVLSEVTLIPTIELSVHPAAGLTRARSPWVLLRAATVASSGGWVDEALDAWDVEGTYLGSARQLRLVIGG